MDDCKECNSKFAHCFHGKCVCKPGYVGDGKICVPKLPGKYFVHIRAELTFLDERYTGFSMGWETLTWEGAAVATRGGGGSYLSKALYNSEPC